MERRHEELLKARLEDAALHGCSHVTQQELYIWYGVQKLAANTYRDLVRKWDEVVDSMHAQKFFKSPGKPGQLMFIDDGHGGMFLFGEKMSGPVNPD
jgi:hypothetical protein